MISVIACTNRKEFVNNIIENFQKQSLKEKELILILNSSAFHMQLGKMQTVRLFQFPENVSLGECLNRGASFAKYDYIAKMDDDDFYGVDYLTEAFNEMIYTNADVVGKSSFYIYFKKNCELRLYNPRRENRWIVNNGGYKTSYFFSGATLVFKKDVLQKVLFPDVNLGEDSGFQRLCYDKGLKMYTISKKNYAYVRYPYRKHHHSDANDALLRRLSRFITNTPSIEKFFEDSKKSSD